MDDRPVSTTGCSRPTAPNGLHRPHGDACRASARRPSGIWVRTASAHEARGQDGGLPPPRAHGVQGHRAPQRARRLALALEVRGGSLDAYTGRDHTSYQAHVLDARPAAGRWTCSPTWCAGRCCASSDLELERKVVLEEINGVEDTPDDLVFELHAETLWPEHPYGYSILGTRRDGRRAHARPTCGAAPTRRTIRGNCVIAAAGQRGRTSSCWTVLEREGWFEGRRRGAAAARRRPARRPRGVVAPGGAGHRRRRTSCFGTDTFR